MEESCGLFILQLGRYLKNHDDADTPKTAQEKKKRNRTANSSLSLFCTHAKKICQTPNNAIQLQYKQNKM